MKTWSLLRFVMAAAFAAALAGCTVNGGTIYKTIETEVQTTDNSLLNTLTAPALATTGPGTYFVAAGTIYKGVLASGAVTWTPAGSSATQPYNVAGALCNALAFFNNSFWAGFPTGSLPGLYGAPGTEPTTASWVPDADLAVSGKQVIFLRQAHTHLFMSGAVLAGTPPAYQYDLEYLNTTGPWNATGVSGLSARVVGVAYSAGRYYMATTTSVSSDGGEPPTTFATAETLTPALASDDQVNGIFGDPGETHVFVLTKKGGLYQKTGAGAWTQILPDPVNSVAVSLLSIAGPVDAGGDVYLVGSDGYGYYSYSVSGAKLTRFSGSTIGLYSASVGAILVDKGTSPSTVLMGTNGAGVWRAAFDTTGSLSGAWTQE